MFWGLYHQREFSLVWFSFFLILGPQFRIATGNHLTTGDNTAILNVLNLLAADLNSIKKL